MEIKEKITIYVCCLWWLIKISQTIEFKCIQFVWKTSMWKRVDFEMSRHNAQFWLLTTGAMCVNRASVNETFGYIGCQEKCQHKVINILLTFLCANVMSWHHWTISVGRGLGHQWPACWFCGELRVIWNSYGTQFVMMLMVLLYCYIQITFEKVSVNSCIIRLMMSDFIVCHLETMDIFLIKMSNGQHNCTFVTPL